MSFIAWLRVLCTVILIWLGIICADIVLHAQSLTHIQYEMHRTYNRYIYEPILVIRDMVIVHCIVIVSANGINKFTSTTRSESYKGPYDPRKCHAITDKGRQCRNNPIMGACVCNKHTRTSHLVRRR